MRLDHLRTDLQLADSDYPAELARAIAAAEQLGSGLELALHLTDDAENELTDLASRLDGARVDRVLVFHTNELATDPRWVTLARERLREQAPNALFAGGTNANFCELNRFRPAGSSQDGIVYSINPQIHAFDELSLAENIAGQAETVRDRARLRRRASGDCQPGHLQAALQRRGHRRTAGARVPASSRRRSIRARCPSSARVGRSAACTD